MDATVKIVFALWMFVNFAFLGFVLLKKGTIKGYEILLPALMENARIGLKHFMEKKNAEPQTQSSDGAGGAVPDKSGSLPDSQRKIQP